MSSPRSNIVLFSCALLALAAPRPASAETPTLPDPSGPADAQDTPPKTPGEELARPESSEPAPPGPDSPQAPDSAAAPEAAEPEPEARTSEESVDLSEIQAALAQDATTEDQAVSPPLAESAEPAVPSGGGSSTLNPDLSLILDTSLAYFSEDHNLQTGDHDPTATGFNLGGLELSAGSVVDPYLRFDAHLVFSAEGVEIEEAYGTTLALPWRLQARFGQFLHRFGRINSTHPHSWDFVDQPFAVGRVFGGEGGRGLGMELSWLTPLPWYVELVGSAQQADGEGSARSFFGAENPGVKDPLDLLYVTAVKQFFPLNDDWSLLWGLSSALGPNATGPGNRSDVLGTDIYLKYRPVTRESQFALTWQSELYYRRREIPAELLQDISLYSQLAVQLSKRWALAGRYEFGGPARGLDGATKGDDGVGLDPLDPDWTRDRHRFASDATFWPTEFSRFRLQGSCDLPEWRERGIWSAFLAAELVVGAHGAHQF